MSQSSETDNKIGRSKTVALPSNQTSSVSSSITDANGPNGPNSQHLLSYGSTYEPRNNAAGGQGRTSVTNELSSGNSSNTALPTQAFGSSRQSSASRSRFRGTTADSLYKPRNNAAGRQGRTSATNELSSGNSSNTALPTQAFGSSRQSSASRSRFRGTTADSLYEPRNNAAGGQERTSATNELSSGNSINTALPTQAFGSSRQSSASSSRFRDAAVSNAATAGSLFGPISRPATGTRLTSQLTREASNVHLTVPTFSTPESPFLSGTASTIYNQTFPSANSNLNGGRAARGPPMTGSFIQHPQNAAISSTLPGIVLPHQAPGSNVFIQPNFAAPTQPPQIFANAIVPTGIPMNPMPILATRIQIRQAGPDLSFRTSDNRVFTRFGQVDPTDWAQLDMLSHPTNLETLLSSDGTLYVRVPDRLPDRFLDRFRATPPSRRAQTSSPPAVAGRKFGEADLLNRLGPSTAELEFPTVAEVTEMVPQGGIKVRELVEIFEEHVRCESGKRKFAQVIEKLLDGGFRLEEGGRLIPKWTWREMVKDRRVDEEGARRVSSGKLRRRVEEELRWMMREEGGGKTAEEIDASLERMRRASEELLLREQEEMVRETARLRREAGGAGLMKGRMGQEEEIEVGMRGWEGFRELEARRRKSDRQLREEFVEMMRWIEEMTTEERDRYFT